MNRQKEKKGWASLVFAFSLCFVVACAPVSDDSPATSEEMSVSCNELFKPVFISTYYDFARNNSCNGCHGNGIGPQFSIDNQDLAFVNFYIQGEPEAIEGQTLNAKAKFRTNAIVEPGHKSVGMTAYIPTMDSFEAQWAAAAIDFNDCLQGN